MSTWSPSRRHPYPPDWPKIATRAKQRAGWRCEACGARGVLTADLLDFNPRNCSDDNLIALCHQCRLKRRRMTPPPTTRGDVVRRLKPQGAQFSLTPDPNPCRGP